jgi:hypothetical protein
MLTAFTAFGAAAPACARQIEEWEELRDTYEASTSPALQRDLASLAFEYADRAVDAAMSLQEYDLEDMPADLLATISNFLAGEATRDDVLHEVQEGRQAMADYAWNETYDLAGTSTWECAIKAGEAALLENVTRCVDATIETADHARDLIAQVRVELGNDADEVETEETMWQLGRAVEVLEAHGGRL